MQPDKSFMEQITRSPNGILACLGNLITFFSVSQHRTRLVQKLLHLFYFPREFHSSRRSVIHQPFSRLSINSFSFLHFPCIYSVIANIIHHYVQSVDSLFLDFLQLFFFFLILKIVRIGGLIIRNVRRERKKKRNRACMESR